jgi:chromate transporter
MHRPTVPAMNTPARTELFLGFAKIGLLGFGGVAPWARHIIVAEKKWLTERDYASILGVGQVLPGPNTVNSAIIIGDRFHGTVGALLAALGILCMPVTVLIGIALLYDRIAGLPSVDAAIGARCGGSGRPGDRDGTQDGAAAQAQPVGGRGRPRRLRLGRPGACPDGSRDRGARPDQHRPGVVAAAMNELLRQLGTTFVWLSLLQFGGTNTVVPEMHRQAVDIYHWMDSQTFANLFALAQLAPGPNVMIVSLIGWQVAGIAGLAVATVAMTVPPCLLAFAMSRFMRRAGQSRWLVIVKDGLVPLAIGMILASGWIIAESSQQNAMTLLITVAAALVVAFTELNLLWPLSAAIVLGLAVQQLA